MTMTFRPTVVQKFTTKAEFVQTTEWNRRTDGHDRLQYAVDNDAGWFVWLDSAADVIAGGSLHATTDW